MRYSDQIAADQCGRYKELILYSTISCTLDYIKCDVMFDGHGSTVHVHGHMGACMHPHMYKRQCT